MAQIIKVQARYNRVSGITADAIINTFHFVIDADGRAAAVAASPGILGRVGTFYQAIQGLYPTALMATPMVLTSYTLADPIPRTPLGTLNVVMAGTATAPLPAEVAVCLSYRGVSIPGVPPARTRGRIYLGPFSTGILSTTVAAEVRPSSANLATIRAAALNLRDTSIANATKWVVFSPTNLSTVDVAEVSTDDAFDTQRRRGADPTVRTRAT